MTLKIYGGCPAVFKAVLIRDRVLVFAYFDCIRDRDRDEFPGYSKVAYKLIFCFI